MGFGAKRPVSVYGSDTLADALLVASEEWTVDPDAMAAVILAASDEGAASAQTIHELREQLDAPRMKRPQWAASRKWAKAASVRTGERRRYRQARAGQLSLFGSPPGIDSYDHVEVTT